MSALASRVDEAVASLSEKERRALALRERDGAAYRDIAEALGTGREGVAELLVSARLGVWGRLHDAGPPPRRTPQCAPARYVLSAQADGESVTAADLDRAREHFASCEPCQAARLALREAELACRTWSTTDPSQNVSPERPSGGIEATRSAGAGRRRRRLAAAAVALVLLLAVIAAAFGGDDPVPTPGPPKPGPGSAQAAGKDVIPPPGDKFCPENRTDCK